MLFDPRRFDGFERNLFEVTHPDFPNERLVACRNPELAESDSADEDDADAEPEQVDPSQTREYWRNRLSGVDGRIQTLQQQLQSPLYTSDPRGASSPAESPGASSSSSLRRKPSATPSSKKRAAPAPRQAGCAKGPRTLKL